MTNLDEGVAAPMVTPDHPPAVLYRRPYVNYVIGVLTTVYVFNFVDRQILSILMQPIKEEMQISDTALGFLSGIAFALFYATLGIPIARLADRWSRVNIITISLSLWSLMTAVCGLAQNYWQLLISRILVGVGEAGGGPSSHSLIADYVPMENRSTALGIFALGVPLGLLFGFLIGGWLEELYGWRVAFLSVGLPGLLLAVVVRLTLREPPRGHADGGARVAAAAQPPIRDVARALWKQKSFRHLALATAVQAIAGYGVIQWVPSFLHRSHQMTSGEIGTALALILGVGGAIGTAAGGYIADRMGKRDMRWQLWIPAIGAMTGAPFAFGIYLAPTALETLAWFAVPILFINAYHGPAFAMTQALAPVSMRAMAAAVLLFVLNIIGLGLGPQLVGIASDLLHPLYGNESLRYALLCVSMVYVWAAAHFWMGARTLRQDLASVTK
ncbi:MAG: spinster family MFS transporter [Pseudomonadota bacterium]|jgi:predicted MFS family arabinose efflux permease|nr:MFS transporter [Alphaproteobacteria bacterium]